MILAFQSCHCYPLDLCQVSVVNFEFFALAELRVQVAMGSIAEPTCFDNAAQLTLVLRLCQPVA